MQQGGLLSQFLAINWVMKTSTVEKKNAIQWTLWNQLDDLDFADDFFLSHTQQQMQEKTWIVAEISTYLGLNIHKEKSKVLKVNTTNTITRDLCPSKQRLGCLTQTWSQCCSMAQKHGGPLQSPPKRYKHLSTYVWDASSRSYGQIPSATRNSSRPRDHPMEAGDH